MNGRLEKELQAKDKMNQKLKGLPEVFSDFYYYLDGAGKSYTTSKKYIDYVEEFMKKYTDNKMSEKFYKNVKPKDINLYMSSVRTRCVNGEMQRSSDSICATKWSALKTFFDFLREQGYIASNPVSLTKRPTVQNKNNVVYMNKSEINTVIDKIKQNSTSEMVNRNVAIFSLGISTGLRVSAISQINMEDINFENNTISVIEKRNKYRTITFGENLNEILQKWINDRNNNFSTAQSNALFLNRAGKRLSTDGIRCLLRIYADGINGKHITPHKMRASTATNLYEQTGDIFLVADQLGHVNISTTKKYTQIGDKKKQERIAILDSLI